MFEDNLDPSHILFQQILPLLTTVIPLGYIFVIRIYNEVAIIMTWSAVTIASNNPTGSIPRLEIPIVLDEA